MPGILELIFMIPTDHIPVQHDPDRDASVAEVILRMFVLQHIVACGWYGIGVTWHKDSVVAVAGQGDPLPRGEYENYMLAFPVVTPSEPW